MTLGQNITTLRKAKKISQGELGRLADTSGDLIGRYERDEVKPSIEVIIKIADALNVSIDYLVGKSSFELDKDMLKRLEDVSKMDVKEKEYIFYTLDAMIKSIKLKNL
ncbi:MAG: transcriptional regulator [Bacteroidetes bacterium GWF2_38_335]|nr:MAG: transcriptional regulator [Bacteroidetes bacterium GWF2_38_335]HBS86919.1 XRE family transcriptional regulator [Bacteroidales bacterium]